MAVLLQTENLTKRYGSFTALDDLTFSVAAGEVVGLLGPNGSGKTTALRLVNALVLPTAGAVRVAGRHTTEWDPIRLRRRTGYVIQDIGLLPHLTVAGNAGYLIRSGSHDEQQQLVYAPLPPSSTLEVLCNYVGDMAKPKVPMAVQQSACDRVLSTLSIKL